MLVHLSHVVTDTCNLHCSPHLDEMSFFLQPDSDDVFEGLFCNDNANFGYHVLEKSSAQKCTCFCYLFICDKLFSNT